MPDFNEAAAPAPKLPRQLIISDWDGTLQLGGPRLGQPNAPLFLFLTLASKNHDVMIATGGHPTSVMTLGLPVQQLSMKKLLPDYPLPDFAVTSKFTLRNELGEAGKPTEAYVVFDDFPNDVPTYINTRFTAKVEPDGFIENLRMYAKHLGFLAEFDTGMAALNKARDTAPKFGITGSK